MSSKQIIAVIGSTGLQGGSVARYLLTDGTFAVRAITRKVDSPAAQELKKLGAEVVAADLDDIDSLKKAFRGAYGVFGVTVWGLFPSHNYDQKATQAHEEQHGYNLVDAAEAEGIKHVVYSTLDHDATDQVYVYHFESKYNIDQYLKTKKLARTSLYTSSYYQNTVLYGYMTKDGDELRISYPAPNKTKINSYDVNETGAWVLPAFKNPEEWIGKDIHAVGEALTAVEYAEILSKVTGKDVKRDDISEEVFESKEHREKVGDELWLNLKSNHLGAWKRDFALSLKANPKPTTLAEWAQNDAQFKAFAGL